MLHFLLTPHLKHATIPSEFGRSESLHSTPSIKPRRVGRTAGLFFCRFKSKKKPGRLVCLPGLIRKKMNLRVKLSQIHHYTRILHPLPPLVNTNSTFPTNPQKLITKKTQKNIPLSLTINALSVNISPALNHAIPNMTKLYSIAYWETMTRLAELLIVVLFS